MSQQDTGLPLAGPKPYFLMTASLGPCGIRISSPARDYVIGLALEVARDMKACFLNTWREVFEQGKERNNIGKQIKNIPNVKRF